MEWITIDKAITLAGNRGQNGALGPLLYADWTSGPKIRIQSNGVRITGLRIQGGFQGIGAGFEDPAQDIPEEERFQQMGIELCRYIDNTCQETVDHIEIDNNELYGWGYGAIYANKTGQDIHIHHNRMWGLGYGVSVNEGYALIEANFFDHNRHSIASTGRAGASYEARYNIIGSGLVGYEAQPSNKFHAFDVHGDPCDYNLEAETTSPLCAQGFFDPNVCATFREYQYAGSGFHIHHNTFRAINFKKVNGGLISIRGVPREYGIVEDNDFYATDLIQTIVHQKSSENDDLDFELESYLGLLVQNNFRRLPMVLHFLD